MATTLEQIRAGYPAAKQEWIRLHCPYSHLLQPLSMRVARIFIHLGIGANTTTGLAWLALTAALGLMSMGGGDRLIFCMGAGLLSVMTVLDNVDGHVARATATTSRAGQLLDDALTWFHLAALPLCLGVALYHNPPVAFFGSPPQAPPSPFLWLALASVRSIAYLLTVVVGRAADRLHGSPESRLGGRGLFSLAKTVAEYEVALLLLVGLLDLLWLHHLLYSVFYVAVLGFVSAMNLTAALRLDRVRPLVEQQTFSAPPTKDSTR